MTLSASAHRANNFDAFRLLGAFLVLVGHAYPLHGRESSPGMWGSSLSTLGLIIFFSLSGYLIATSWDREPRFFPYLQKRALRIFPALVVLTVGTAFVLGPIISALPVREYLAHPQTWQYLSNAILAPAYALPGVFQTVPYVGTVNGSLWSLPVEFVCYLLVPLVAFVPRRFRSIAFLALATAFTITSTMMISESADIVFYSSSLAQATTVWPYFMVGAAIAYGPRMFPLRLDFALIGLIAATLIASIDPVVGGFVWTLVIPYVVIALGSAQTRGVSAAGRFGDFSYGIYLYAFPVQQTVLTFFPNLPFVLSTLLTGLVTTALAVLSWHLIEKQALKFKPRRKPPVAPETPRREQSQAHTPSV
jgi:peptidoglycan/LPS O-acetylase OafA/YrhL